MPATRRFTDSRDPLPWLRFAFALLGVALAAVVFIPPLRAGFVSDSFALYARALRQTPVDLTALFIPTEGAWYRPLTDTAFWIEVHLFGDGYVGYHVVTLALHVLTSVLLVTVTRRLTNSRPASLAAGLVFLTSIHAHEPLWDIADLHTAMAAPLLVGAVLWYMLGRRRLAWATSAIALFVDEAGLLTVALVTLYAIVYESSRKPERLVSLAWRMLPFLALAAGYVAMRLIPGSVYAEGVQACRSVQCMAVAGMEYFNRLWVRPDALLSDIWGNRGRYIKLGVAGLAISIALLRPWEWRQFKPIVFAMGWVVGASLFFALTLWPYIPDRFLYIPDVGLALLVGAIVASAAELASRRGRVYRGGLAAMSLVVVAWLVVGVPMIIDRGSRWISGGDEATAVLDSTQRALPQPPKNATLVFQQLPDAVYPVIPPGNSGAWVFHNQASLHEGLQLRYHRGDFIVVQDGAVPSSAPGPVLVLRVEGGSVVLIGQPTSASAVSLAGPDASEGSSGRTVLSPTYGP